MAGSRNTTQSDHGDLCSVHFIGFILLDLISSSNCRANTQTALRGFNKHAHRHIQCKHVLFVQIIFVRACVRFARAMRSRKGSFPLCMICLYVLYVCVAALCNARHRRPHRPAWQVQLHISSQVHNVHTNRIWCERADSFEIFHTYCFWPTKSDQSPTSSLSSAHMYTLSNNLAGWFIPYNAGRSFARCQNPKRIGVYYMLTFL